MVTFYNIAKVNYSSRFCCYYFRTPQGVLVRIDLTFVEPDKQLTIFAIAEGGTIDLTGSLIYSDQGYVTLFVKA